MIELNFAINMDIDIKGHAILSTLKAHIDILIAISNGLFVVMFRMK